MSKRAWLLLFIGLSAAACTFGSDLDGVGFEDEVGDEHSLTTTAESGSECVEYPATEVASCPELLGEVFCSEGRGHVNVGDPVSFDHNPPHSGVHWIQWGNWGEYTLDDPLPRGNWVHNMEHGGVVFSYRCPEGCDAELEVLRATMASFAGGNERIILTPDDELEGSRFAATSWTWAYSFDSPVQAELECFVMQHFNNAPEDVP